MVELNKEINNIYNQYCENKLSHTYLIETNSIDKCLDDVKKLVSAINCPNTYNENCTTCNLCNLIKKNNLPSLKIISPDGNNIKKSQIEDIKNAFNTKPIYSKFNIYIILYAEKLNASSANSMLKFVEEPSDGIIGFFITNNKDVMMDTIKSRCQLLTVNYSSSVLEELGIDEEKYNDYVKNINDYLNKIKNSLIVDNKELLKIYPERSDITLLFQIMFKLYYEVYLKSNNLEFNKEIINNFQDIDSDIQKNLKKLTIISDILANMLYNINVELLLDKFVIEMRGIYG